MPRVKREAGSLGNNPKKARLKDGNKSCNEGNFTRPGFSLLSQKDVNGTSGEQKCKMAIIESCPTNQQAKVISLPEYIKSLAESGVLIIILPISVMLSTNEAELLQEIDDKVLDKQTILQFKYEDANSVYYKESNAGFRKLLLKRDCNIEDSFPKECINFELFCILLHFGTNIGKFSFDLIETEVVKGKSICGSRLIDWAVKNNNILCSMFLKLFDTGPGSLNESSTRFLDVVAESGTMKSFEIWCNPDINDPSQKQILDHSLKMSNESLLMIAVKSENHEIVSFLIDCGLSNLSERTSETLSDVVWKNYTKSPKGSDSDTKPKNRNLDILIKLLYNDAPFPRNFDKSEIKSKLHVLRFKKLICDRQNLHDAIRNGQLAQVQSFTENNKLKVAYEVENQCALLTAIASKKFNIYSLLRSKGFSNGFDGNLDFHLQSLDKNEKVKLRKCNLKYFKTNESQHIMDLVSKSRLAFGSDQNSFSEILRLFEKLDAISEMRPILRIVASSDKTDIVFDFNSSSVEEMDPTGSEEVYGRTLFKSGNILIGAGRENENMLLGTLAHELTHYAMQLVFNNNCLPFTFDDESRENEFQAIAETYDNQSYKSKNEIIARALNENYSLELKMAELIVRVPHLIAMHWNETEALAEIREEFSFLFDFFERKTIPDLIKEEKVIKVKRDIRGANAKFGVFFKAIQSNWPSNAFFPSIDISKHIFVQSSVPDLVLESFVKFLLFAENEIDSRNIFVNLELMFIKENFEVIKSAAESKALQKIIVIEDSGKPNSEINEDKWKSLFNQCVIVFISNNKNSSPRKFFSSVESFNLNWIDLSRESKSKIMKSKVSFQDQEVFLREIVDDELLLQDVPLELLLEPSKLKLIKFSESVPKPPRVFIERTFINSVQWEKLNTEDICEILKKEKIVLIADSAGMGKSTSAAQIARKLKLLNLSSWVVFIDLKQHTDVFVRDGQPRTVTVGAKYFSQKLLKLGDKFEQKLFESFFRNSKVIFVIDGFDEISPNYKQFVMKILKTITSSKNQVLVTTRPHLVEELKEELNAPVFKLMPFTYYDQIEFLTKYWQHTKNIDEAKVKSLLKKCQLTWYSNFYSTPIHIFMLAEVLEDQDLIDLDDIKMDIFSLYKHFVTIKLKVWVSKGPLAEEDSAELQQSNSNLQQIFHKLALKQLFKDGMLKELNLSELPEDSMNEMVSRVGIVSYGPDGTFQFTHRTFAEYFAADFILRGVIGKNIQSANLNLFFKSLTNRNLLTVRKFMNEGLCYFKDKLNAEALSRHFEENEMDFSIDVDRGTLHGFVSENRTSLVTFVFENLILATNLKIKLVKNIFKDVEHIETFKVIHGCIERFFILS